MQRFAVTATFEGGVYTLTTDEGTLKLSGLDNAHSYQLNIHEADKFVDVGSNAVAENGTLTVVENSAGYDIRLQGQNFTLVGSSDNDGFIFANVEPNVTIKYTVGSGGNDYIDGFGVDMTTVKLQFVTADDKPVAYSIKYDGNTVLTVGQNTISFNGYVDIENRIVNGVGLETIDGLNVNVDETGNGYYEISSAADLQTLADYVNSGGYTSGKVFKLTADISDWTGVNFAGIGIGNDNRGFIGTFDGNGFTIRNLTINGGTNSYVGLFGDNSGTIKNVKLDNVNVSGKDDVGGLVGSNSGGKISNCTVTNATVNGDYGVGGLIGYNDNPDSSVTGNTFDGTVSGNRIVGSLVGYMARGTLTGNKYHGNAGDVGFNDKGTVSNTRLYSVAVSGATFTVDSDAITIGTNTYYASGSTVTVEGQNFALGSDLSLAKVTYLGTDGTKSEVVHVLTGNETSLSAGTYIINDNITLNALSLGGNVNLILADGKTLTVDNNISGGNLTVFGQIGGTGKLNVTGTISSNTLNFTGGNLTADTVSSNTLNFKGGNLTAGTVSSSVTLDWTQDTDTFSATNFNGSLTIADGKRFYDTAGKIFSGTLTDKPNGQLRVLDGVRLDLPSGVTIASGKYTQVGSDIYVKPGTSITLSFADGLNPTKYRVNGELITDATNNQYTFTMGDDITSVSSDKYTFSVSGNTWSCKDGDNVIFTLSGVQNLTSSNISGNVVTLNAENFTGTDVTVSNLAGDFVFDIPDGKTFGGLGRLTDNGFSYKFKYTLDDGGNVVYAINSVKDLVQLMEYTRCRPNYTVTAGKTFKLTADIDLSDVDNWTPIGDTGSTSFCGTFDGGGHVISNLTSTVGSGSRNGLFGTVNYSGTIKNVTLINATINGGSNAGALAGYVVSGGQIIDNKYQSNVGAVGWGTANNNTRLYTFNTTSGVTAEYTGTDDLKVTFDGKDYYASGATFKLTVDADNFPQYYKIRSVSGATANADGTYTATINGDLTVQVDGYPKIAELAFDSDTNKYTVASTADFLMLASYVSGGGDISGLEFDFTATEYTINDLKELRALADYVNSGGDTSGLTFKLAQNISGVNFHIGDSDAHRFKGTLDGNGYTISVNYTATTENCALFNYVEGATIKNLHVDGTINTSAKLAAGIAAYVDGTTNITDCRSSVTINSTVNGVAVHGGLVATVANTYATLNLTNCIFDGKLLGSQSNSCGGLVGGLNKTSTANVTNCLFAPSEVTLLNKYNDTLVCGSGTVNLNGGYYTQALTDVQGTQVYKSLTLPEGVEATATDENTVKFGNTTYYVSGASITLKVTEQPDGKFLKGATRNDDGTYTYTIGNTAEWADIPKIDGLTFDNTIGAYKIATLADLQTLATYISNDGDTADLTFKLTADISDVDFVIGTFKGTLDGNGHKITLNHTASTANCALFSELNNATIKNLHVDGTIETSGNAAGFAITTKGTTTITDCRSSVEFKATADGKSHGGFVRIVDSGTLNVTNCIFDGKFIDNGHSGYWCGLIADVSGNVNLANCLVAPAELSLSNLDNRSSTFYVTSDSTGSGGDNNYYTQVISSVSGGKQVYAVTLPKGVAASGAVFVVDNTAYAPENAELTFAGKTGYIFSGEKSLTVTEAVTVTGTVTFDTANHYVLADNPTTLVDTANTADYPDLIQVYELTLPSGVTVNGGTYAVDGDKIYAAGEVTFAAGTGAAIKPVTVNTDISAADIYYTVTIPAEMEIVNNSLNDGDTYTVNGTTYYKRGATLTLRLKDNYTAAAIMNGGDTLDLAADGTYSITVSGVTTITVSGISGRDPTMDTTKTFTLSGLTTNPINIIAKKAESGDSWTLTKESDSGESIDWLTYDGNGFTLTKVPTNLTLKPYAAITIKEGETNCSLSIGGSAFFGNGATWTLSGNILTPSGTASAGFYYDYTEPSNPQVAYESESYEPNSITINDLPGGLTYGTDVTVKGYSIVLSKNAVEAIIANANANGGTVSNNDGYAFEFASDVQIEAAQTYDKVWTPLTSGNTTTLTYNDGTSGYSQKYENSGYGELTISSAKKFSLDVTLPSDTDLPADYNNWFTVTSNETTGTYNVTINDAFLTAVTSGSATVTLTDAGTNSYSLVYNGTVGDDLTLAAKSGSGNDYTFELSAYKEFTDNTFTYHAAQQFTISGLKSGLFSNGEVAGVTLSFNDDTKKITVMLSDSVLGGQDIVVNKPPNGYTVVFDMTGISSGNIAGSTDASAEWSNGELKFTAAGENAGYKLNDDASAVRHYGSSGGGGESFTISGLKNLSDYTFKVDGNGNITAINGTDTVNVGTITKTESNGKTTFNVTLNDAALPDNLTNISLTSEAGVYFKLNGGSKFTLSNSVPASLTALNPESTPPPNRRLQIRRRTHHGGIHRIQERHQRAHLHLSIRREE